MAVALQFEWDRQNTRHLSLHKVTRLEFEQVIQNEPLDLEFQDTEQEDRFRSVGLTTNGRLLTVVWTIRNGKIRAITAFPASVTTRKHFSATSNEQEILSSQPPLHPALRFRGRGSPLVVQQQGSPRQATPCLPAIRKARKLTPALLQDRLSASARKKPASVISLRIPEADLALARKQAEQKGLPYQTYIKSLLHETLEAARKEESRLVELLSSTPSPITDNKNVKDEALLAHINRLPHGRATLRQLTRELGAKGLRREEVERSIQRLTRKGTLIELRNNQFQIAGRTREFSAGTLRMHRDGFGFVMLDTKPEGMEGDVFIPPDIAQRAMHGDRVLVRLNRMSRDGRVDGEIIRVLHRANQTLVGEFKLTKRGYFVAPYDERIKQWLEIPEGLEIPKESTSPDRVGYTPIQINSAKDLDGLMVNVEILEFPDEDSNGVGRIIEVLGHQDDFGVDVEIMIRKHHLPHQFHHDVLEQARSVSKNIGPLEWDGREDFRSFDVVTIDGETARDFDDAVWVDKLPHGNYALHVHIADVSWYVRPGSPIDKEARFRGTSVYFPDRAVPMLPVELSTDICSLRPHEERLVVSALLEIDPQGQTVSQRITRGVIRSAERMTYTNVYKLLEGTPEEQAELRARYAPLVPRFELMRELAHVLNRMRTRRGAIDFDLPEAHIEFDPEGAMTGVSRTPRTIANRLIEEFMLAANEAVSAHLEAKGSSLFRVHEQPDAKRVLEFEEQAARFGYSLGLAAVPTKKFMNVQRTRDGRKLRKDVIISDPQASVSSRHYQKLVGRLEGKPEERILSYLMLRSLKQARYAAENLGHFALAAPSYTHFTSPIRRYPDLIIHRLLTGDRIELETLSEIAEDTSFTERRAAEAERELIEWKKVKFMIDRVGDEFNALIISTQKYGFFVELEDLYIEGLVPIDGLPQDRYTFEENSRKIIGQRSKHAFSIGDPVRVVLVKVDIAEKRLTFLLAEEEPKPRREKKRKKGIIE